MNMRSDPYQIFRYSKTPAGLYARKRWLKEPYHSNFRKDFEETVCSLLSGQFSDGSWGNSFLKTIKGLFGLHLTVRERTESVQKGLDWLLDRTSTFFKRDRIHLAEKIHVKELFGLPFTKGSSVLWITCATLFLFTVFGRLDDPGILRIYDWLQIKGSRASGRWCGWSSYNNFLRAFVVHPVYSRSKAVDLAVKNLRNVQKVSGTWADGVPFYQTVNALAHLNSTEADRQLALAFNRLYDTQRADGTWTLSQPEWNSFLVIHALRNKDDL
jgi:hypothetical protein